MARLARECRSGTAVSEGLEASCETCGNSFANAVYQAQTMLNVPTSSRMNSLPHWQWR
jgi:hypothetical protein